MRLLRHLFVLVGLISLVAGVSAKFYNVPMIFANISPIAHVVFANTCLLLALSLKLLND